MGKKLKSLLNANGLLHFILLILLLANIFLDVRSHGFMAETVLDIVMFGLGSYLFIKHIISFWRLIKS